MESMDNVYSDQEIDQEILISASDITKRFGKKEVLKGINLEIKEFERVALVGGNGAGKTTLLNILSKNDKKFFGEYNVKVKPSEMSFQFQTLNYPNEFSLYKLLQMFTVEVKGDNTNNRIKNELKSVDLYDHRNKFPSELSGGQLQKFNLLMTMATQPKLIFFDEILSGLDQPSISTLINFIKERIHGKATTITISHSPNEIFELCDRVVILKNGLIEGDYNISKFESVSDLEDMMKSSIIEEDSIDYDRLMILDKRYETNGDEFPSVFVKKVRKWYDLHYVLKGPNKKGITTKFYPGDSTAIIGRNGSGKSTFAEIIAGSKKPSKGKVDIDIYDAHSKTYHNFRNSLTMFSNSKKEINYSIKIDRFKHEIKVNPKSEKKYNKEIAKLEKKIEKERKLLKKQVLKANDENIKFNKSPSSSISAIQFQKQFYPTMLTIRDVIVYNLQLAKIDYDEMYINYLLESIGLTGSKESSTHALSGGQRQKLNIILSLIKKPALLVLDELTTGLDLLAKEKLLKLISEYMERENPITFIVTHSLEDIEMLANRLMLIESGDITYDEPFDFNEEGDIKNAEQMLHSLEV